MSAKPETVSCPCGATIEIETQDQATLDAVCPDCGQMLEVMVSVDPRTKARRIGILVKSASMAPRRITKSKIPGARADDIHTAKCTCGAQITILYKSADTIYTCTACDAEYTATLKQGRTGAVTALVLRPVLAMPMAERPGAKSVTKVPAPKPPGARPVPQPAAGKAAAAAPASKAAPAATKPASKVAPAAPAPKAGAKAAGPIATLPANLAPKENLLLMTKGDIGAQEIVTEDAGRKVACFCGADLPLKGDFHREILKCGPCGLAFRVFSATNPKTNAEMAIMIPRDAGKAGK
jgi:hypothetical protein